MPETTAESENAMSSQRPATCKVISTVEGYAGKQGLEYFAGISAESAGATRLCMHLVTIPPGGRAKAHVHDTHETTIFVLSGEAAMLFGEGLQEHLFIREGEFLYIPAGVPHLPYNPSSTVPCRAVLARTDPSEQESVRLLPELDHRAA